MILPISINIFNKKIVIENDIIDKYEQYVGPFTNEIAEYLAVTSGCNENSTPEELLKGILDGINDEVAVYIQKDDIVLKAVNEGIIC